MATGDVYRKIGFDASGAITSLNNLTHALNNAQSALTQFQAAANKGSFGNAANQINQASNALNKVASGSNTATNAVNNLNRATKGAASTWDRFQRTLGTIAFTRVIIGGLTQLRQSFLAAAKEAQKFQLAIQEIQTIAGSLGMTSQEVSSRVLELSSAFGTDAVTTAEGLYQVLSNQVVEAGESFQFLAEAQKLAITTVSSVGDSVDALSSIMNAYQLDVAETARVSDVLFKGVELGRFRLEDIADIIGRVTGITAQMGISFEEVTAAIAAMTQTGVRADTAITQLRAIVTKLLKPTEAMKQLYKDWGVKDGPAAIAAFGGLAGVLDKLRQETGGSVPEMTELFNEVRGLAGAMGLGVGEGQRFADVLKDVKESAGASAKAFEGFQSSQVQQLVIETNKLKNAMIAAQSALIPLRLALTKFGTGFLENLARGFDVLFLSVTERAAKETEAANKKIQENAIKQRREFTRFNDAEYQKDKQNALQAAAAQTAGFQRILDGIGVKTKASGEQFRGYLDGIVSSYEGAFKGLEKFIDGVNQKIKDSQKLVKTDEQALSDEKFAQDLKKTEDAALQQKKILERAQQEYWDGRNKLSRAGLNEELQNEARETLKRAEQLFRDASSKNAFARYTKDADAGVMESIQARIDGEKRYQANLAQGAKDGAKVLNKFKGNFEQVKAVVDAMKDKSKELSDAFMKGDQEKAESLFKDLQALEGQLKKLGFTASEVNFLKQFGENTAEQFNQQVQQGLDKSTYNWLSAITSLREQLQKETFKFNASPEVQKAVGDPTKLASQAKALGVDFNPATTPATMLAGDVFKAAEEQLKGTAEELNNVRQAQYEANQYIQAMGRFTAFSDQSVAIGVMQDEVGGLGNTLIGLASIFDKDLGKAVAMEWLPPPDKIMSLMPAFDQLRTSAAGLRATLEGGGAISGEQLDALKQRISDAVAAGQLTPDQVTTVNQYVTQLELAAKARERELEAAKKIKADLPKTRAANEAASQFGDPLEGAALEKEIEGVLQRLNQATQEGVGNLKTGLNQAGQEANTTATSVGTIGSSAAASVGGVASLTQQMTLLKQEALAAAQAVAAASSGGAAATASAGKYFRRGGLGVLAPMSSRGVDTIPAMIQRGEYVVNRDSSRKFFSQLNAMNQGIKPVYRREGGAVTNVGDVNVTVNGGDTSRQTVRAIAAELNRELRRGTIRLGTLRKA